MSTEIIGLIGIGVSLLLLFSRMPVGFVLALVGFLGTAYLLDMEAAFFILASNFWEQFASYNFTVIPLFIFMGMIISRSAIGTTLFDTAYKWLGQLPGGLAIATTAASAGFGAMCGSGNAAVATMGTVSLPEMRKRGYDISLATGTAAATSGVLGVLIPPSTILIIYGLLTQESIGRLFLAGIFPGLLLAFLFISSIYALCRWKPNLGPRGPVTSFKQKLASLTGVIDSVILFCVVMGGILVGWFTPTEAGGIGAGGALLIALGRRQITWQGFKAALLDTMKTSCMVMVLLAGGIVSGRFLAISRIPFTAAEWAGGLDLPAVGILAMVFLIWMIAGCFVDNTAVMVITVPIFVPVITMLGYDPIWFGIVALIAVATGAITPPVGIFTYVIKGVAPDVPIGTIFKGVLFFLPSYVVGIVILTAFPQIALFLPNLMMK